MNLFFLRIRKILCIFFNLKFFIIFFRFGVAPSLEHKRLLKKLNIDFIADVGSNKGQFSLLSSYLYPNIKIHSFEPIKKNLDIQKKIFKNNKNIFFYNYALGNISNKSSELNVSIDDDSSSILSSSLNLNKIFPGTKIVNKIPIIISKLDNFFKSLSISNGLLKIDVQGYELNVLLGSSCSLEKFNWMLIECSFVQLYSNQPLFDEIFKFCSKHNFILKDITNIYYHDGFPIQADFLFNRLEK